MGAGFVESLARPGGNATGFSIYDYEIGGKWLELLKEIAPSVRRAAVIRDPAVAAGLGQFAAIQAIAPSLGLEVTPVNLGHVRDIERTIAAFARSPNVGLVVIGSASTVAHRDLIAGLAAQHRLPAVYPVRIFVTAGGLMNYGPDLLDQFRRAASYVDRILKGETQLAVSLLTEKNHPSGSTTTSKRSFDTSTPQKESMAIFVSHPC